MRNSKIFKPNEIIRMCEHEESINGNHYGIFNFRQRRQRQNNPKKEAIDKQNCVKELDYYYRNLEIKLGDKWCTIQLLIANYIWVTKPLKPYDDRDKVAKDSVSFGIPYDTKYELNGEEHHVGRAVEFITTAMEYYTKLEKDEGYLPHDYGRNKMSAIHETTNEEGEINKWIGIKINRDKNNTGTDGHPLIKGTFIDGEKSTLDKEPKNKVPYRYINEMGEEEKLTTHNIEHWSERYMKLAVMTIELQTVSSSIKYESYRAILNYTIRYDPQERLDPVDELEAGGDDLSEILSNTNTSNKTLKVHHDNDNDSVDDNIIVNDDVNINDDVNLEDDIDFDTLNI